MKLSYKNDSTKIIESCLDLIGRRTGVEIMITHCCGCNEILGVKLGGSEGNRFSDTYCPECGMQITNNLASRCLKNHRGNSAIWPLIGCLLAGGLLAWEYVYAIINCL